MKDHLLDATPTIKKLHEIQKCRRHSNASIPNNPNARRALQKSTQSLKKTGQKNCLDAKTKPEEIGFDTLVSGLGTWIDLICRCRFYSKTSTPGN